MTVLSLWPAEFVMLSAGLLLVCADTADALGRDLGQVERPKLGPVANRGTSYPVRRAALASSNPQPVGAVHAKELGERLVSLRALELP